MSDHHHYYRHQDEEYPGQEEYYDQEEQYQQYDPSQDRPSFTSYWKKSKDHQSSSSRGPKNIRFVQTTMPGTNTPYTGYGSGTDTDAGAGSDMGSGYNMSGSDSTHQDAQTSGSSKSAQDKAQLRRAQVRKAQIQHRQRKANYVKQLEQDVSGLRDLITTEQQEVEFLRGENDLMRSHAQHAMGVHDPLSMMPMGHDLPTSLPPYASDPTGAQNLDYYTMNLGMDDTMNRPSYRINGTSSPSYYQSTSSLHGQDSMYGVSSRVPSTMAPLPDMNPDQSQQAINFILALEHVCWDHFRPTDFQPETTTPGTLFRASEHTMMATSLALRTAPKTVFESISKTKRNMLLSSLSTVSITTTKAFPRTKDGKKSPIPEGEGSSWIACGLSLSSLYSLACSLTDPDVELTPVQAFFELATCWPLNYLLKEDTLGTLKREFVGVVKCPHYGAQIERAAFESIVERVLERPQVAEVDVDVPA